MSVQSQSLSDPKNPPVSVVGWWDALFLTLVLAAVYIFCVDRPFGNTELVLLVTAAGGLAMVPITYWRSPCRGAPRPQVARNLIGKRVAIKSLGIMSGVALMLLAWGLIHEYRSAYSQPLFDAMRYVLPWLPVAIVATVYITEWRLGPSEDHSWQFGLIATGRWKEVDWPIAHSGLFGWIVKGFFLPMNFCTAVQCLGRLRGVDFAHLLDQPWLVIQYTAMQFIFMILLIAIIPGYFFSSRLLNTHNRRVDGSAFAWFVTLLCYPPLNAGTSGWFFYHAHKDAGVLPSWADIAGPVGYLSYTLGAVVILCEVFHYYGEATCHLRSSHLSHRGIITNGLFRYCKHPVYTAKCIGWFFMWLPFCTAASPLNDVRQTLGLAGFCVIFALRCWVEERLLSSDPVYVAYGLWMDQHGLFRFAGKAIPFFRYGWRLRYWQRRHEINEMTEA